MIPAILTHPALLVLVLAVLDRLRGSPDRRVGKAVVLAGIGAVCASLAGYQMDETGLTAALMIGVMHSIGYGQPLGWVLVGLPHPDREFWQVGILARDPWAALAVRGAATCLPLLVLGQPDKALHVALAFALGFVLAPIIAMRFRIGDGAWALGEYLRGGIVGTVLAVLPWRDGLY